MTKREAELQRCLEKTLKELEKLTRFLDCELSHDSPEELKATGETCFRCDLITSIETTINRITRTLRKGE